MRDEGWTENAGGVKTQEINHKHQAPPSTDYAHGATLVSKEVKGYWRGEGEVKDHSATGFPLR